MTEHEPTVSGMIENMISWAKGKVGNPDYAGWCLSFIEDALEVSNDIEIFGGDSAKESCVLYADALRTGIPAGVRERQTNLYETREVRQ